MWSRPATSASTSPFSRSSRTVRSSDTYRAGLLVAALLYCYHAYAAHSTTLVSAPSSLDALLYEREMMTKHRDTEFDPHQAPPNPEGAGGVSGDPWHSWWQSMEGTNDGFWSSTVTNAHRRRNPIWKGDQITLVTHADVNKFGRILVSIARWGGPVSLALLIKSYDDLVAFRTFVTGRANMLKDTAIHLYIETPARDGYPYNVLRNIALDNAPMETDYVLQLDVDFVTTTGARVGLERLVRQDDVEDMLRLNRTLLVLPSFDVSNVNELNYEHYNDSISIANPKNLQGLPNGKSELLAMIKNKLATGAAHHYAPAQGATDYNKWYQFDEQKQGNYYQIKYRCEYEPYVLGYKHGLPRYWEGWPFRFGWDKVSWYMELHVRRYKFAVLAEEFLSHIDHPGRIVKTRRKAKLAEMKKFQEYLQTISSFDDSAKPELTLRLVSPWLPWN